MKKYIGLIIILICLTSTTFYDVFAINQGDGKGKGNQTRFLPKTATDPASTVMNINNITCWITSDGFMPAILGGGSWNGSFPKGAVAGFIYQEGIVWGGLVNDGATPTVRVGGNTYFPGTTHLTRIFRVRPDYATGDLTDDAANFFLVANSDVTAGQIAQIKAQYAKDWAEWPANLGAPYEDVNHDGIYEPNIDIPGIPGASQTIWLSYDDRSASSAYGSPPIGIKVNETLWAYAIANPLGNCIFKKVDMIYQGLANTPSNATIDSMYIVQWSDPDVGNSTDDFAGCDTTLGLGYAYNSTYNDAIYKAIGSAPPAGGFDFLQGVSQYTGNPADSAIRNLQWVHGYKPVNSTPLSTFVYFAAGGAWSDPAGQQYAGTLQWYSLMRGYQPNEYPISTPFPTNVQGVTVGGNGTYLLPGDPVTHTGWIDGEVEGAGDRRICLVTGPITMSLGDTSEIVSALVGGIGADNLSSITVLKFYDNFAQYAYDQLFNLPNIPSPSVAVSPINGGVILNWDNTQNITNIESADHKGYNFEGYIVYQLPSATTDLGSAKRIATYDIADNVTTVFDLQLDLATGSIINKPVVFGTDAGVQRHITITNDAMRGNVPLVNGTNYYFAVTAYGYNPDPSVPFHILQSSPVPLTITPQYPNPGINVSGTPGALTVTHNGSGNGTVTATVIDPTQTTGHNYKVSTFKATYYQTPDLKWHLQTSKLRKTGDVSGSTLSFAANFPGDGTIDLTGSMTLNAPGFDFVDGVQVTLPVGVTVVSAQSVTNCYPGSRPGDSVATVISGNTITWGDSARTTFGCFDGSQVVKFKVRGNLPFDINYLIFDDGYDGNTKDAVGTATAGAPTVTQYQWNIKDSTTNTIVLDHQTIFGGVDIYAGTPAGGSTAGLGSNVGTNANLIVDGLQVTVAANFAAPLTIGNVLLNGVRLHASAPRNTPGTYYYDDAGHWTVTDYTYFGVVPATFLGFWGNGVPATDVTQLQQDYELRWTGTIIDTTVNGKNITMTSSGGQMATLIGARGYDIKDDPLNPNYGTSSTPFAMRIPFEVWNSDLNEQVNFCVYNRVGNPANDNPFQEWTLNNRIYTGVVNSPYDPAKVYTSPDTDPDIAAHGTWNWVFYASEFTQGDKLQITYANPVQPGVDNWTFTAPNAPDTSIAKAKTDVNLINVFPNPYYGFQSRELTRSGKYVTFSHLPAVATIRIFDLAGHQVRVINKNDPTQFINWDLNNQSSYPVASGVYVVYVDMPGIGATKILKLAVVQEQQILNVY